MIFPRGGELLKQELGGVVGALFGSGFGQPAEKRDNQGNIICKQEPHILSRITLSCFTPRPPSMRGGTCPLLLLKMQGESRFNNLQGGYSKFRGKKRFMTVLKHFLRPLKTKSNGLQMKSA